jgi:hypothetical protein
VERIRYSLKFFGASSLPPGYLFLCPLVELETEVPGCLGIPDCPAYWSLDPLGAERLSPEKASNVGFPEIELCTQVYGRYWDSSVHAGIRQFHEAKCFDPYDQEVALDLGVPLFQVSCDQDDLCARCKPDSALWSSHLTACQCKGMAQKMITLTQTEPLTGMTFLSRRVSIMIQCLHAVNFPLLT